MPNRHDFSRPTIIILLAIRSLAKTQQLMLLNGETTIELLHTFNQSGNLSERVILLKRSLIIIEKIVSIARFLFSFFPFFFLPTFSRKRERAKYPKVIAVNFTHAPPFLKFFLRPRAIRDSMIDSRVVSSVPFSPFFSFFIRG